MNTRGQGRTAVNRDIMARTEYEESAGGGDTNTEFDEDVDSQMQQDEDGDDLELQYTERQRQRRELGDFVYKSNKAVRAKGTNHLYYPRKGLEEVAERTVQLVPIRLELEEDGVRLHDQLTWNLNENMITPEHFAALLVDDFDSPAAQKFIPEIVKEIKRQVLELGGGAEEDAFGDGTSRSKDDALAETSLFNDYRLTIKLDINVGSTHLRDKFEWPLFNNDISPEEFSKLLCSDLGIAGEFIPAIAFSIREQVCQARINLEDAESAPGIRSRPIRMESHEEMWSPDIRELTEEEIDKIIREKERNSRRMRRHAPRRRGY